MQMVKPLINDRLLKITTIQRPPLYKDHIASNEIITMAKVYLITPF